MIEISVILCTHNPRTEFLERVLDGLRLQTLSDQRWELLVIDNASAPALADLITLEWHPNAKIVVEPTQGLTSARLTGIQQSNAELLVFVDDDAILAPDYLDHALTIMNSYPLIGAFGGSIRLEFQSPPAEWTRPHWPRLAERSVRKPIWSNFSSLPATTPWGVGMCLRQQVADKYSSLVKRDPVRLGLGRSGSSLMSGEDDDMARTSHLLGMATGLFPELNLLHLIPDERLREDYLIRLVEGQSYSGIIVETLHGARCAVPTIGPVRQIAGKLKRRLTMSGRNRQFLEAKIRGQQQALSDIAGTLP